MTDSDDTVVMHKEDWAERRRSRRSKRGSMRALPAWLSGLPVWQRWALGVPVALVALVLLFAVVEVAVSAGRIHPGVRVAGVGLGGLTPVRAAEKLESDLGPRLDQPVGMRFEEHEWSIEPTRVAATLDTTAAVGAAMGVGRSGDAVLRVKERLGAWVRPVLLPAPVTGEDSLVRAVLDEIAAVVDREPVDASVVIDGLDVRLEPSALGLALRRDEVAANLLGAFASDERVVEVSADFVPVRITDEDAAKALEDARRMISGPAIITYDKDDWEFSPQDIAAWVAFRAVPASQSSTGTSLSDEATGSQDGAVPSTETDEVGPGAERHVLEAYISAEEASKTVTPRVGTAGRPAQDARFKVSSGTVTIVPSQDGVGPDIEALAQELTVRLVSDGERTVALRTMRVKPALTTEAAQAMGISERISTYTTNYTPGNKPRVNNIHTLADAIDGTLIPPGGTFSFNETVGPRTAAKGYQEAPAIVSGKLVPQLGGGICQFGTTIFNTVFESGLPVVERKNHSFYISHYPKGRDATLSWGGPDFKFKNDTEHYVLIATGHSSSSVTVSLYGTDPGYEVKASVGPWYDVTPHAVKEVPDPTLPVGTRIVEDGGVDGRKIVVTRTVTKGGTVVREDKFTSVYRPKEEVIRVGTMDSSAIASGTATR